LIGTSEDAGAIVGFISEDRTRRYRPATSKKNSSYADTGIQSNFERFYIDPITGSSKVESNLHLNIYEDKK
jgi:putative adhesin/hemagglutinin/hemolysin